MKKKKKKNPISVAGWDLEVALAESLMHRGGKS